MSSNISWVLVVVICIVAVLYYLIKKSKMRKLKDILNKIKIHKIFELTGPKKAEAQIQRLKDETEKEIAIASELRGILDAKRALVKARTESSTLRKEIDNVSEKSMEWEKRAEKKAQDTEKIKPRRL